MAHPGDEEVIAADERRLAGLGYKQELRRGMGAFSNYALSLKSLWIVGGVLLLLAVVWLAGVKDRFVGPPAALVRATSLRA